MIKKETREKLSLWKGGVNSDKKHKNKLTLKWYHNNRDYYIGYRLKNRFGMTIKDYDDLLEKQGGKCAICEGVEVYHKKGRLVVDHCHRAGKVRGLLCTACNLGLGKFKDNSELLSKAINYLNQLKEI